MDIVDQAEALAEHERERGIAAARARAAVMVEWSPTCLNCDEPTPAGARWCDPACRDDYLRRMACQATDE
ncbi:MAG: hypothetical protein IT518_14665 [Burkholderiales bacterium]|nr:hypothetical protein [Burkholderiales bacterium]